MEKWREGFSFVAVLGMLMSIVIQSRVRALPLKEYFSGAVHARTPKPLDEKTRVFAIFASLTLIVFGLFFLAMTIQAHIWEGEKIFRSILAVYLSILSGLRSLVK